MPNKVEFLTLPELAARWKVTPKAIYQARHRRRGPVAVRQGQRLLFRIADVEAWEMAHIDDVEAQASR